METPIEQNLMTDAIEGPGISYWAEVDRVKRNVAGDVVSFRVRENEYERDGKRTKWVTVNAKRVRKAAHAMVTQDIDISRHIRAQFVGATDWDYDSIGVDCVIQLIAFGKIIFG